MRPEIPANFFGREGGRGAVRTYWRKIWTKIIGHPIYAHPRAYQLFVHLFLLSAWEPHRRKLWGGTETPVGRGQYLTTYRNLASELQRGPFSKAVKRQLERDLDLLKRHGLVETTTIYRGGTPPGTPTGTPPGTGGLLITVKEFETYQATEEGRGTGGGTPPGTPPGTPLIDKRERKERKDSVGGKPRRTEKSPGELINGRKVTSPAQKLYELTAAAIEIRERARRRDPTWEYDRLDCQPKTFVRIQSAIKALGLAELERRIRLAFAGDPQEVRVIGFLDRSPWSVFTLYKDTILQRLQPGPEASGLSEWARKEGVG